MNMFSVLFWFNKKKKKKKKGFRAQELCEQGGGAFILYPILSPVPKKTYGF